MTYIVPPQGNFHFFSEPAERKLQGWEGLGSSWVSLGANWEGLRASWEGPEASWEGLRDRWEAPGGGGTEEKKEKKNGAFLVYGGTIGHRSLRGCCPKNRCAVHILGFQNAFVKFGTFKDSR